MGDSDDDCPELIDAKVPVVVLTGFLGSGKTTLLQYILTQEHGLKIAVIVNEFEFGRSIEKGLTMKSSEKDDDEWLELNNGCLCCTAKTQTVLALENLIAKQGSLDLILIETSGMADPAPIAAMFWQDDALQSSLVLAGIITLVDCAHIVQYLEQDKYREATQQLLVADKIIFNKVDLVPSEADREAIRAKVAEINPVADTEYTSFSKIADLRALLSMNTTSVDVGEYLATKRGVVEAAAEAHGHTAELTSMHFEIKRKVIASKYAADELFARLVFIDDDDQDGEQAHEADASPDDDTAAAPAEAKAHRAEEGGHVTARTRIVRGKAAIWVLGPDKRTPMLMQAQSIGELFDVVPMASAALVPHLENRFLFLGKGLTDSIKEQCEAAFTALPQTAL